MKPNNFIIIVLIFVTLLAPKSYGNPSQSNVWKEVTPESMEKLLKLSPELKTQRIALTENEDCALKIDPVEKKKCEERRLQRVNSEVVPQITTSSSTQDKDAAILVFALVGTVMIVVWVPYVAYLGYKLATSPDEVSAQHLLSLNATGMANMGNSEGQASGGTFAGTRYTFLMNSKAEPNLGAGLSAELGYYDLEVSDAVARSAERFGSYWLAGPTVQFTLFEGIFLKLDLLAGRSFDSQLELFTRADITANVEWQRWVFGLGVSGLYFDLREREGILNRHSNASIGLSGNVGFRF